MKRDFDPSNHIDIAELKYFLKNNKWKRGCPFNTKFPFSDVPSYIKDRYIRHILNVK